MILDYGKSPAQKISDDGLVIVKKVLDASEALEKVAHTKLLYFLNRTIYIHQCLYVRRMCCRYIA